MALLITQAVVEAALAELVEIQLEQGDLLALVGLVQTHQLLDLL
jgi:hypothetical protein